MKNLTIFSLLSCTMLAGCRTSTSVPLQQTSPVATPQTTASAQRPVVTTIAFGSCSDQRRPQPLWDDIVAQKPDVWIWLGDNIYGDSEDVAVLKAKYDQQRSNPIYQQLRQSASIVGVWDDHDYGVNDGGKEYPRRKESQQLMLNFLDVPSNSPLRRQEGAVTR